MSLKELSHRHRSAIRRLVTGQPHWEICLDLGMSSAYLSILKRDPLFANELELMSQATDVEFIKHLGDMKSILERLKVPAALRMREMVMDGSVGGRMIKPDKQADMVVKMLALDKPTGGGDLHLHLTEAVVHAYMEKYHKGEKVPQITEDVDVVEAEVVDG